MYLYYCIFTHIRFCILDTNLNGKLYKMPKKKNKSNESVEHDKTKSSNKEAEKTTVEVIFEKKFYSQKVLEYIIINFSIR
jgi:hypothetical protein